MADRDLRSLPVIDAAGAIVGMLDEHDISAAVIERAEPDDDPASD
jgi:CBS domain-containing protein